MSAVIGDTHAIVWYLLKSPRLSAAARTALQSAARSGSPALVASISLVEAHYLVERGRLPDSVPVLIESALADPTNELKLVPLDLEIAQAVANIRRREVPEMPDRIIAATALYLNLPLVTRDRAIRSTQIQTIW